MAKKIVHSKEDVLNTEAKIKQAAQAVFMRKGYAATRTRVIAEESGINLALINYYFRSKENLFNLVMLDCMKGFIGGLKQILNREDLSLEEKLGEIVAHYLSMFKSQPDLPLFILHEIRHNPNGIVNTLGMKQTLTKSHFYQQLKAEGPPKIDPMHFLMNIIALTVFPFIASPLFKIVGDLDDANYMKMMNDRKKLIPIWMKQMLQK
ncbi:MAG: TetR/AcrR family transcriptional regulator [bacterium]|nr:TetR/AcrR family transcriptional regulator [bacterium]